ncbi:MAG: Nicotinamidase-related amidase [Candidatus Alkanophagales archaeon MCA70_species_1]|nr:Nicotinamidase-related amidase [Candidatus Alkanophaga volatiphilum]
MTTDTKIEVEEVTIKPVETAIIIVDMQKDFCYENGALYVGDAAKNAIKSVKSLLQRTSVSQEHWVFTQDWHRDDDPEFKIWPKHCVAGTDGAEIVDELGVPEKSYVVKKRRYSAFFGTDLDLYLRERDIVTLIVTGVVTNICVLHTAADAVMHGYAVVVPEDCVAATSDYEQEYGLRHMKSVLNAKITKSDLIKEQ